MATIKGEWLFNETISRIPNEITGINFKYLGSTRDGTGMKVLEKSSGAFGLSPYLAYYRKDTSAWTEAYSYGSNIWWTGYEVPLRTIVFETEQTVSDEFYEWFTTNAVSLPTITDLTGTTWKFGSKLSADTTKSFLYNVDWTYVITYDEIETGSNSVFGGAYIPSDYYFPVESITERDMATNKTLYYAYVTSIDVKAYASSHYPNFQSFTVTFTGGADVNNTDLITWIRMNARLVEEPTTTTTITYGGETIATLEAGQTATIKAAEYEFDHDLVFKAGSGGSGGGGEEYDGTVVIEGEAIPIEYYDGTVVIE